MIEYGISEFCKWNIVSFSILLTSSKYTLVYDDAHYRSERIATSRGYGVNEKNICVTKK